MAFEHINWEKAGPDDHEYQRAVQKRFAPLPVTGLAAVKKYGPAGVSMVGRAAKTIIRTANSLHRGRRNAHMPLGFKTADQIVSDFLAARGVGDTHGTAEWHALLSYALALAKRSTMYWKIANPKKMSFCSYCRHARPVKEFSRSEFKCDRHFRKPPTRRKT